MEMVFSTNFAAVVLQRRGLLLFSLSLWERVGVRVLLSNVTQRRAPSPGLRPASPRGRGQRQFSLCNAQAVPNSIAMNSFLNRPSAVLEEPPHGADPRP